MASAAAQDWIEWTGGKCPVPTDRLVDIKFGPGRTGKSYSNRTRQDPLAWDWQHGSAPLDIIAYRVVSA